MGTLTCYEVYRNLSQHCLQHGLQLVAEWYPCIAPRPRYAIWKITLQGVREKVVLEMRIDERREAAAAASVSPKDWGRVKDITLLRHRTVELTNRFQGRRLPTDFAFAFVTNNKERLGEWSREAKQDEEDRKAQLRQQEAKREERERKLLMQQQAEREELRKKLRAKAEAEAKQRAEWTRQHNEQMSELERRGEQGSRKSPSAKDKPCVCMGANENCFRCMGRGYL